MSWFLFGLLSTLLAGKELLFSRKLLLHDVKAHTALSEWPRCERTAASSQSRDRQSLATYLHARDAQWVQAGSKTL